MSAGRRGRRARTEAPASARKVDYRNLRNPFPPMAAFSEDRIEALHEASLSVLEELGIKVLHPGARDLYRQGGARIDGEMVHIGREMVEAALASAPKSIRMRGAVPDRDVVLELGRMAFQPGAGCPHATDLARGRRPGTIADFRELVQITQSFDVLHMVPPLVEAQDVPMHLRHMAMTEVELTQSDKVPFLYSRGTPQVMDGFEMIRDFRGLSDAEFRAQSWCYTIINTNSPRTIDMPMAQGLIDFARHGQMAIITPFTLMGAMAPVTVAGAMTLSHAEALAAITLSQLAQPGAPVCYGTFTSNVDMKSGAPAFGTPEHFTASLVAGQLARRIGLPWRCAGGSAANINDAQAANETQFGLWGCLLAGATVTIHAAGWLEGGLTVSYEKIITDLEVLQMVAELCAGTPATDADIALDALREVPPMGHFFGAAHTMARYQTQFYEPLVGDWSNFGQWSERGAVDANHRATGIWRGIVDNFEPPPMDPDRVAALQDFIARRTAEGGAPPES
ncbi:trimethylamine methyltransferase family protein [Ruegeria pomeroyi]|uniref:Methyltransferase n=2 Tax=Ruegeria pomeroyi TaxID=89184 RepID=Q5LVY0_RUEPO|nr:trimethylamine methyltransferase family protein [Ruegeria pomeroyi]HCE72691.1 trimethylamine methyltransferase [Ruegeria sp.]AAV93880.1 trimethylamine methyltransferase family protein [Ruegeria pomeroyi DSS-3]NVK95433.1 trimethylamine methyltransferase family protein [Ruegeria pomeroyi]NVL00497.1 trimethylamine methyltransferase family protein [Ruegeria pomeroyi]QWV07469.1 trimethylamine methyltransferase family protein [Ruegeria pomeroyi]